MKKLLVALAAVLVSAATYGQGLVNFNNLNALTDPGTYGIWRDDAKTIGAGNNITATLYLNTGGTLTALGSTTFFTDAGSEFLLQPVDITVPDVASGATASFVVQAWDTSFDSFQAAVDANGLRGQTEIPFDNKVGGGTFPPENTVFNGFVLVPEPSTIALGLIGAGALLLRRRK